MLFKSRLRIALLGLLGATYCFASPDNQGDYYNHHTGFYFGGDVGIALNYDTYPSNYLDSWGERPTNGGGDSDFQGLGLGATLGYMVKPWIGVELNFTGVPDTLNLATQIQFFPDPALYYYNAYWYGAAVRLKLLPGKKLDLFVKGGIGVNYLETKITTNGQTTEQYSVSNIGGIFGGGIGYNFTKNSELIFGLDGIVSPQIYYLPKHENFPNTSSYGSSFWGNFAITYLYYFN